LPLHAINAVLRCFESEEEVLLFASATVGLARNHGIKGCRSIASSSSSSSGSLLECQLPSLSVG
jgi:hypothetical protein